MYVQVAGGARVLGVEVLESAVQVTWFCSVHTVNGVLKYLKYIVT